MTLLITTQKKCSRDFLRLPTGKRYTAFVFHFSGTVLCSFNVVFDFLKMVLQFCSIMPLSCYVAFDCWLAVDLYDAGEVEPIVLNEYTGVFVRKTGWMG